MTANNDKAPNSKCPMIAKTESDNFGHFKAKSVSVRVMRVDGGGGG